MIRHVRIQNFRCLRDVSFELSPLTAFVGPNASGKTAILQALDANRSFSAADRWLHTPDLGVSLRVDGREANLLTTSRFEWYRSEVLQLSPENMREHVQVSEQRTLGKGGSELANALATLPRRRQDMLSKQFCELVPAFADISVRPGRSGMHRVVFQDRWDSSVWYEPGEVSDGSILPG